MTQQTHAHTVNAIRPFQIQVSEQDLGDLQARLARAVFPEPASTGGWTMGTDTTYLQELVRYWHKGFDWRTHEKRLNQLPQFITEIDGITVHFVHVKSRVQGATPLLLTHGWPDTFHRFSKVIDLLTDPESQGGKPEDAFDLVIPSIPGFGFSGHQAFTSTAVADLWAKLMDRLGYDRFMAAGGDLGSTITLALARQHPQKLLGIHLTDAGYPSGFEQDLNEEERQFAGFIQGWWYTQGAYAMLQATKPQTLAVALMDSPVGLASWILSFVDTGSENHDVEKAFGGRDELLTSISLYWFTRTAASSAHMYLLDGQASYGQPAPQKSTVPTGFSLFPREAPTPESWVQRQTHVVRYQKMPRGGHFAALEEPVLLAGELRELLNAMR